MLVVTSGRKKLEKCHRVSVFGALSDNNAVKCNYFFLTGVLVLLGASLGSLVGACEGFPGNYKGFVNLLRSKIQNSNSHKRQNHSVNLQNVKTHNKNYFSLTLQ